MAESEKEYLLRCQSKNICPVCQKAIDKKVGSGSFSDGVFCSTSCFGKWNVEPLLRRHLARVEKGTSDE